MLTKLLVVHPRFPAVPFTLDMATYNTSPFQVRDITGLGPVAADVASSPYANNDGEQVTGTSVGKRNIVLTLAISPNYKDAETAGSLRQAAYMYFMPRQQLTLKLYFSELAGLESFVQIDAIVETVEPSLFTQEPNIVVSLLCPSPYFRGASRNISGNFTNLSETSEQ